jgi:hypothetical protein
MVGLSACNGSLKPNAKATATPTVLQTGETVTLDASSSNLHSGVGTYSWEIAKAPTGSSAEIQNPHDSVATFIPDLAGEYEFNVTVANEDWDDTASVTITALGALDPGATEVTVLVIHDSSTIHGWQPEKTVDDADTIIRSQYPSLVSGWEDGTILATEFNVPIADAFHPEKYQVINYEVSAM